MVYGAFLGALLAFNAVPALTAAPLIVGLTVFQGLWGVVFRRSWISGERSDYGDYVERLKRVGLVERTPWVMYMVQAAVVWGGFGLAVYAAGMWTAPWSWWGRLLLVYLAIGVMRAVDHVTTGKRGTAGVGVAFLAVIFLWPIVVYTEWRQRR